LGDRRRPGLLPLPLNAAFALPLPGLSGSGRSSVLHDRKAKMKLKRTLPFLAGLALFAAAVVPSAKPATQPMAAQLDAWVAHLVAPGDRLEIGYAVQNAGTAPPTATLYVRNDLRRSFQPVRMTYG